MNFAVAASHSSQNYRSVTVVSPDFDSCPFCSLLKHGFTLLHVRDELVGSSLLDENFQGTLPAFEEILAENLVYDIEDAHKVRGATLVRTVAFGPKLKRQPTPDLTLGSAKLKGALRALPGAHTESSTGYLRCHCPQSYLSRFRRRHRTCSAPSV